MHDPTHMMSMDDLIEDGVVTPRIDSGHSWEKELN